MDALTSSLMAVIKRATDDNDDYNYYGSYTPNLGFSLTITIVYGFLIAIHLYLLRLRQPFFSWMLLGSIGLQFAGFVCRTIGHFDVHSRIPFIVQSVCLIVAPVLFMGALYFQLSKLIEIYGHRYCLLRSPTLYSRIFISFDIFSFLVQSSGGGIVGAAVAAGNSPTTGKNVFLVGDIIQIATMTAFIFLILDFYYKIYYRSRKMYLRTQNVKIKFTQISQYMLEYQYREKYHHIRQSPERFVFKYFPIAFFTSVIVVYIRCFYRLAEFVGDQETGPIHSNEGYFIGFDGIIMIFAAILMTIFHPGFAFLGREVDIPITPGREDPETIGATKNTDMENSQLENQTTVSVDYQMYDEFNKENNINYNSQDNKYY